MSRDPIIRDRDPLDEYELCGALGEGSYGAVWKGKNRKTGEAVAIKIVPFDNGDDAELRKEIQILEKAHDDFVVGYFASYEKDQNVWIVMELAEAGSVNDVMHICDVALEEGLIKILVASALLGLDYLHSKKMIHRDIKAGNILLTRTGQAKLADFGVSAQLSTMNSRRNTVIGTPFWMAPEVIQETQYDYKADIWSLGITLIELADREPPFANIHPMRAIFMIPSRPPPTFHDESVWSKDMISFLQRCLVKNPEERASAKELLQHPFVKAEVEKLQHAKPRRGCSPHLKELVDSCIDEIIQYREEEATKLAADSATRTTLRKNFGDTALLKDTLKMGQQSPQRAEKSGTLVEEGGTKKTANNTLEYSGTLGIVDAVGGQPDFMAYFQTVKADQLDKTEAENLRRGLSRLDNQFKNDILALKKQYSNRKNALMSAAGIKLSN
jgi:serine/threonine protein kinase